MTTRFLAIAAAALMLSTSLASAHGPGAPVGHVGGFHGVAPGRSFAGHGFGGFHASGGNFGAPRYGGYGLGDYYGAGGGYGGPVYADGPSYSGGNGIGAGIAGVILGLATGGAIGSAIYAQPPVVYAPAPVYGQPLGARPTGKRRGTNSGPSLGDQAPPQAQAAPQAPSGRQLAADKYS
jgi:hypothetical protein